MIPRRNDFVISAVIVAIFAASSGSRAADLTQPINFSRDVRPILANNCFHCHGPDAKERKADLRLDVWESKGDLRGAQAGLDSKNAAASELLKRITSDD